MQRCRGPGRAQDRKVKLVLEMRVVITRQDESLLPTPGPVTRPQEEGAPGRDKGVHDNSGWARLPRRWVLGMGWGPDMDRTKLQVGVRVSRVSGVAMAGEEGRSSVECGCSSGGRKGRGAAGAESRLLMARKGSGVQTEVLGAQGEGRGGAEGRRGPCGWRDQ